MEKMPPKNKRKNTAPGINQEQGNKGKSISPESPLHELQRATDSSAHVQQLMQLQAIADRYVASAPVQKQQVIQLYLIGDINPALPQALRQAILGFVNNQNGGSPAFRDRFYREILGSLWYAYLRVDMIGSAHAGVDTPHVQFTQVQRNGQNQNIDNIRQATNDEIRFIIAHNTMPATITDWAADILRRREERIQNPPPPAEPFEDMAGAMFDLFNE